MIDDLFPVRKIALALNVFYACNAWQQWVTVIACCKFLCLANFLQLDLLDRKIASCLNATNNGYMSKAVIMVINFYRYVHVCIRVNSVDSISTKLRYSSRGKIKSGAGITVLFFTGQRHNAFTPFQNEMINMASRETHLYSRLYQRL